MPNLIIQLSETDYLNACRAAAQPSRQTKRTVGVASVVVAGFAIWAFSAGYVHAAVVGSCVFFFALVGAWIGNLVQIRRVAPRVFRQQKGLQRPYELTWDEQQLILTSEDGASTTRWTDFHKGRELPDQFLLFLSDAAFYMVPKRAFATEANISEFRALVHRLPC